MVLGQILSSPHNAAYRLELLQPQPKPCLKSIQNLRCLDATPTKACPQEIDVLDYMSATINGDIADWQKFPSATRHQQPWRCPAELTPPNISLLARRLYGKYLAPKAGHLHDRVRRSSQCFPGGTG
jgi:hypothetical protein